MSFLRMPNCLLVEADTRYCHFSGRMGRSATLHLTYFSSYKLGGASSTR